MLHSIKTIGEGEERASHLIRTKEIESFSLCLGEVLRDIRNSEIKTTQENLAKKIGVTQKTISDAENGVSTATVYLLYRYCEEASLEPQEAIRRLDVTWKRVFKK